jgi:hypothetical protein
MIFTARYRRYHKVIMGEPSIQTVDCITSKYQGLPTYNIMKYITVKVWLKESAQPIIFEATITYQKGDMYCICDGVTVSKFPMNTIFRVVEDYYSHESPVVK